MQKIALIPSLGFVVVGCVLVVSGCRPDYPNCETDKDCERAGKPKEFCVARKCVMCRTNNDCGEGQECANGRCGPIAGYCRDKSQCPPGQECIANRCRPCESDTECPSGMKCMAGQCIKPQCTRDEDCPQDQDCVNGQCVGAPPKKAEGPPCQMDPVYFGFDQHTLTSEASSTLNKNADCLKKWPRPANLVGRADPRGTTEYNLALSDKRAQAVKEYLQRLGIEAGRLRPVPRGALDASGTDESSWARDRRVDSEWQ